MPYPGGSRVSYFPRQASGIQYSGPPALPQQVPPSLAQYQVPIVPPAQDDVKGATMQWLIAKDLSDVKKTVIMVGGAIAALILIDMAIQSSRRR